MYNIKRIFWSVKGEIHLWNWLLSRASLMNQQNHLKSLAFIKKIPCHLYSDLERSDNVAHVTQPCDSSEICWLLCNISIMNIIFGFVCMLANVYLFYVYCTSNHLEIQSILTSILSTVVEYVTNAGLFKCTDWTIVDNKLSDIIRKPFK